MALKGPRNIIEDDISWSCEAVAERGVTLVQHTTGSGVAIGDSAPKATLVGNPSGYSVVGILLNDVVDIDQTRYHRNFQKDETLITERCYLLRKGRVTTNKVTGSPAYDGTAYLTTSGVLTPTLSTTGGLVATPKVGKFKGLKDADGYVTVDINLPIV